MRMKQFSTSIITQISKCQEYIANLLNFVYPSTIYHQWQRHTNGAWHILQLTDHPTNKTHLFVFVTSKCHVSARLIINFEMINEALARHLFRDNAISAVLLDEYDSNACVCAEHKRHCHTQSKYIYSMAHYINGISHVVRVLVCLLLFSTAYFMRYAVYLRETAYPRICVW